MSPLLIVAAIAAIALAWLVALFLFLALFAGAKRRDAAQERALREVRR